MPKGKSTCVGCGSTVDTELMTIISGKKYCPHCAPARQKEALYWTKLQDLLFELCNKNSSYMPRLTKEIKSLMAEANWKLSGIYATLKYVFTLETPPDFNPEFGVAWIIRQYYPQAKKYYEEIHRLKEHYPEEEAKDIINKPVKVIEVKRSDVIRKDMDYIEAQRTLKYGPAIDLDAMQFEEEEDI